MPDKYYILKSKMDFFKYCRTEEEKKEVYRTLAKCFHPDKFGNNDMMVELNRQYAIPLEIPKTQFYRFGRTTPEPDNMINHDVKYKWEICNLRATVLQLEKENEQYRKNPISRLLGKINELENTICILKSEEYIDCLNESLKNEIYMLRKKIDENKRDSKGWKNQLNTYESWIFDLCKPRQIVKSLKMMLEAVNLLK